jgi:hypothetical protein
MRFCAHFKRNSRVSAHIWKEIGFKQTLCEEEQNTFYSQYGFLEIITHLMIIYPKVFMLIIS